MRDPLSLNRYAFVRNDPAGYVDPSGLVLVTAKPMQMYSDAGGYGSPAKDKVDVAVKKAAPKKSATTAVDNARTVVETGNLEGANSAAADLYSNYGGMSSSQQQILNDAKSRYGNNVGSWTPMQAMAMCAAITLNQVAEYGRIGATSFTPEETKGMSLKEQLDIVLMSGVLQPLDVMFQAKINNENNEPYNYKIDVNQTHGVIFDGYTDEGVITYSGMNTKTQFKPITDLRIGNYLGLDFVLMGHENQPLDLVGMLDDWL